MNGDDLDQLSDAAEKASLNGLSLIDLGKLSDSGQAPVAEDESELQGLNLFVGDPSQALANDREHFAQLIVKGVKAPVAYRTAISANVTPDSARVLASKVMREERVRGRVRWLIARARASERAVQEGDEITPEMKLAVIRDVMATGNPVDRLRAVEAHNKTIALQRRGRDHVPDPAFLAEYLRRAQAAGRDPVELARGELRDQVAGVGAEADLADPGALVSPEGEAAP